MGLWEDAVNAAKAGNRQNAKASFLRISERVPENEAVYQWLAYISDSHEEKSQYLRKVLSLNPAHPQAKAALAKVLLKQGIQSTRRNDRAAARPMLEESSRLAPNNEKVWLWRASVAATNQERGVHLRKVLEINPENRQAGAWLAKRAAPPMEPRPSWKCPLCRWEAPVARQECPHCGALLSLERLTSVGADHLTRVKTDLVERAIEEYKNRNSNGYPFDAHVNLGRAFLNLRRFEEGLSSLNEAQQIRPDDPEVAAAILRLQKKLAEATPEEAPEETAPSEDRKTTIMVVDDSSTVRKLVAITLERHGYNVVSASSGIQALARINEIVPDLIFLDIKMPNLDGYQICKIIRENHLTKKVPVILLSGQDGFFDRVRGRMVGAREYITKPFETSTLLNSVEKYCGR